MPCSVSKRDGGVAQRALRESTERSGAQLQAKTPMQAASKDKNKVQNVLAMRKSQKVNNYTLVV
jgi:hypothetical protein